MDELISRKEAIEACIEVSKQEKHRMTTYDLIQALRGYAQFERSAGRILSAGWMNKAADRLEELDERVAFMIEGNTVTGTKNDKIKTEDDEE